MEREKDGIPVSGKQKCAVSVMNFQDVLFRALKRRHNFFLKASSLPIP
jgi:hypothetical protein